VSDQPKSDLEAVSRVEERSGLGAAVQGKALLARAL